MENILETRQLTQVERAEVLNKAYWKKEKDLVLYYHYQVTSEELMQETKTKVK